MGLYLYGLKGPSATVKVSLPDGTVVEAVPYRFISKPYWSSWDNGGLVDMGDFGYNHRVINMLVSRLMKIWTGLERPKYALSIYENNPDGDLEYREKGFPAVWLEELNHTKHIGACKRVRGKTWRVTEYAQGYSEPLRMTTQEAM